MAWSEQHVLSVLLWSYLSPTLAVVQVGKLTMAPDFDCEVKLKYEDGSTSGYLAVGSLSKYPLSSSYLCLTFPLSHINCAYLCCIPRSKAMIGSD